jgi:hypothetical protein
MVFKYSESEKEIFKNMLRASYIENLVFALKHPTSWKKYILRVNLAAKRLRDIKDIGETDDYDYDYILLGDLTPNNIKNISQSL